MDRKKIQQKAAELRQRVVQGLQERDEEPKNAKHYLDPRHAADQLGYDVEVRGDLDAELRLVDDRARAKRGVITGLLAREERRVAVSDRFSPQEQRFALAHELAHSVLHPQLPVMHRSRLDGSKGDPKEREADAFAAEYLMPVKWLRTHLKRKFGECPVRVTETLAWWLDRQEPERFLHSTPEDDYALALAIANCSNIGGGRFASMAEEYGVSAQAMAWRLIELKLFGW